VEARLDLPRVRRARGVLLVAVTNMNVSVDTLEIHSVQLPDISTVSGVFVLAMAVYIVGAVVRLVWMCREPAQSLYPYAAATVNE